MRLVHGSQDLRIQRPATCLDSREHPVRYLPDATLGQ